MSPASGYSKGNVDIPGALQRLDNHILEFPEKFQRFNEEELLVRPALGKWSRKEILGHLVDSAINNLKRFTEIQFLPQPYHLISYRQNELVIINNYQNSPLEHLLEMWKSLNTQILYVVRNTEEEKLSFDVKLPDEGQELKTLAWVIADYVAHMEHHFKQIF